MAPSYEIKFRIIVTWALGLGCKVYGEARVTAEDLLKQCQGLGGEPYN